MLKMISNDIKKRVFRVLSILLITLFFLENLFAASSSSDNDDILDIIIPLIPAMVKANQNNAIKKAEEFGFKISFDKIDFSDFYSYKLSINKPNTKDIRCYIGKEEKSIIDDKEFCTVSDEYSGRVGQHSIARSSIEHPSGDYFLTIITAENQKLHSQLFHLPPKKPKIQSSLPRYTTLDTIELTLIGEPNTSIIINGNNVGIILPNGKAKVLLDTSGNTGIKEFVIALQDKVGKISQATFPLKIKKIANIKNIKLSPENILMSLKDEVALDDILWSIGSILNASDYGFDKVVTALVTYKDESTESLSAIELGLEINDKNIVKISGTVRQSSKGSSRKIPILQGLQEGSTKLVAKLDDFTSNEINIVVSEDKGQDNIPPQILIQGDNPLNLVIGQTYQEYGAGAIDNIDGVIKVKIEGAVDTSTVGMYEITYTASDKAENTTTKIRKVIVKKVDSINPTKILLFPSFSKLAQGDIVALQTEIAFPEIGNKDIDDLNINALMVYAYYEGEFIPKLIPAKNVTLKLSDTSILERSTATITDQISGKSADIPVLRALKTGSMTVTAKIGTTESSPLTIKVAQVAPDKTAPVITLNGKAEVSLIEGSVFVDEGATARDDRDGVVDVSVSGSVDTSIIGTYTLTYTARDKAENTINILRKITVLEKNYIDVDNIKNITLNIDNVCREGDEMEIIGASFPEKLSEIILEFTDNNEKNTSFKAYSVDDKKIKFICPAQNNENEKSFLVKYLGKKSAIYKIDVIDKNSPVIKKIIFNETNNSLDIYGVNFNNYYKLHVNDMVIDIKSDKNNDREIKNISLPENIKSGYLYISHLTIFSNKQYLSIKSSVHGNFSPISNLDIDDISIWSNGGKFILSDELKFNTDIDFKGGNYIFINSGDNSKHSKYLYSAIVFEGDASVSLDSFSTAISLTWSGLKINPYLNKETLSKLRDEISKTEEIKELSDYIDKYISQHGALSFSDEGMKTRLQSSLKRSYQLTYTESKKYLSRYGENNNLSAIIKQDNDTDEITVSESNNGNLKIINHSSTPISIAITDTDGGTLKRHTSYDARSVISLDNINYKNCNLEILTPGIWGDASIWGDTYKDDIVTKLRWQSFIFELNKHIPDRKTLNYFQEELKKYTQQNYGKSIPFDDAFHEVMKAMKLRLTVAGYLDKRIDAIADIFDRAYTVADNLLAIYNVVTLSKKINVSVEFPPRIKSIAPNKLSVNQNTDDGMLYFTIKGTGLSRNLQIKLFQQDAKDIEKNSVNVRVPYSVWGDEMEVSVSLYELREYYINHIDVSKSLTSIQASLKISNFFSNDKAEMILPNIIEVNNNLSISSISSNKVTLGDEFTINGRGFNKDPSENKISLGHSVDGRFITKYFLKVIDVKKHTDGFDDEITIKVETTRLDAAYPVHAVGYYELRASTFESHWSNNKDIQITSKSCENGENHEKIYEKKDNDDNSFSSVLIKEIWYRDDCSPRRVDEYKSIKNKIKNTWESVKLKQQSFWKDDKTNKNELTEEIIYSPAFQEEEKSFASLIKDKKTYAYSYSLNKYYLHQHKIYEHLKNNFFEWQSLLFEDNTYTDESGLYSSSDYKIHKNDDGKFISLIEIKSFGSSTNFKDNYISYTHRKNKNGIWKAFIKEKVEGDIKRGFKKYYYEVRENSDGELVNLLIEFHQPIGGYRSNPPFVKNLYTFLMDGAGNWRLIKHIGKYDYSNYPDEKESHGRISWYRKWVYKQNPDKTWVDIMVRDQIGSRISIYDAFHKK